MSVLGWCWRCAERDQSRRGLDTGEWQGPVCERCEIELREYRATFTPAPPADPDQYQRVARARYYRPAAWRRR